MVKKIITIIGINPGTRYLGISVFHGSELRDWRVKVIKGKQTKEKVKRAMMIISSFIEEYKPDALAIKRIHMHPTSLIFIICLNEKTGRFLKTWLQRDYGMMQMLEMNTLLF